MGHKLKYCMDTEPAKAEDKHVVERDDGGKWTGSGNPKGWKKGAKRLKTKLLEEKMESVGYDPLAALIEVAVDKDTPAEIKTRVHIELMSFIYPKRKPQNEPVDIPLGQTKTLPQLSEAQSVIIDQVSGGNISPDTGKILCELLDGNRKMIETEDIEKRLAALENENPSKGSRRKF